MMRYVKGGKWRVIRQAGCKEEGKRGQAGRKERNAEW